jgi:hypothetical protein
MLAAIAALPQCVPDEACFSTRWGVLGSWTSGVDILGNWASGIVGFGKSACYTQRRTLVL